MNMITQRQIGLLQLRYPQEIDDLFCLPYPEDLNLYYYQHTTPRNELIYKHDWQHLLSLAVNNYGDWKFYGLHIERTEFWFPFSSDVDLSTKYKRKKTLTELLKAYWKLHHLIYDPIRPERFTAEFYAKIRPNPYDNLKFQRKLDHYAQVIVYRRERDYEENPLNYLKIAWHRAVVNYLIDLKWYDERYPTVQKNTRFNYKNQLRRKHRLPARIKYTLRQKGFYIYEKIQKFREKKERDLKLIKDTIEELECYEKDKELAEQLGWSYEDIVTLRNYLEL